MINLNEADLKELEAFLMEMPAKYANPILQFLSKKITPAETPELEVSEG